MKSILLILNNKPLLDIASLEAQAQTYVFSRLALLLAVLLCACGDDVRDVPLSDIDLSNMDAVRQVGRALSPPERSALITYAATHSRDSGHDCGDQHGGHGTAAPRTVGQAIATILAETAKPSDNPTAVENGRSARVKARRDELILKRDIIIDREGVLLADRGPAAKRLAEWATLESSHVKYNRQLAALR